MRSKAVADWISLVFTVIASVEFCLDRYQQATFMLLMAINFKLPFRDKQ